MVVFNSVVEFRLENRLKPQFTHFPRIFKMLIVNMD